MEHSNEELLEAAIHYATVRVSGLILPANLTVIESKAFSGLPSGTVVYIPATVSSIAEDAFDPGTVIAAPPGSFARKWGTERGFEVREDTFFQAKKE